MTFYDATIVHDIITRDAIKFLKDRIKNSKDDSEALLREILEPKEYLDLKVKTEELSEEDLKEYFKEITPVRKMLLVKCLRKKYGATVFFDFSRMIDKEIPNFIVEILNLERDIKTLLNNKKSLSKLENFEFIENIKHEYEMFNYNIFDLCNKNDKDRQIRIYNEVKEELGV